MNNKFLKYICKIFKRNKNNADTVFNERFRGMCCIAYNQSGIESELLAVIPRWLYVQFIDFGYIRKPLKVLTNNSDHEYLKKKEWIATELLYQRIDQLYFYPNKFIKHNKRYILPQTIERKKLKNIFRKYQN